MPRFMGIDWAPLNVPLPRRLQTLAVLWTLLFFVFGGYVTLFVLLVFLLTPLAPLSIMYGTFWIYDCQSPEQGGWRRKRQWARNSRFWRLLRDYFPVKLVKTSNLDPSKNYILGIHPHGMISMGTVVNFGSNATGVDEMFPGMRIHPLALRNVFMTPFTREVALASGASSVSRENFDWLLTKEGAGNVLAVVPGGVSEALLATSGSCDLLLKNRKGFVKMALRHGADLVPAFAFGETEIYNQYNGRPLKWLQEQFKKFTRFVPALPLGRGVFQYSFGVLPHRKPITVVVGKPITVVKSSGEPSSELVNDLHKKYVQCLTSLYEDHRDKYGMANIQIKII